ncbi:NlpC/P60 family protein [Gaoshiqia sp. Z1-71]|uniref:C40 family peptidase n=1 Tax=Gaoshiqia hydrogeniformans TaxID=3290090 RepID=UPI003BF8685D
MKNLFRLPILLLFVSLFWISCSYNRLDSQANEIVVKINQQFAPDPRVAIFDIDLSASSGKLVLQGKTSLPLAIQALKDSLASFNVEIVDSVVVLPDVSVGEKTWALVALSAGNMRTEPNHAAEMASQLLMGTPVRILQQRKGWYLVQSPDKYIGWCENSTLSTLTESEWTAWKHSNRYIYLRKDGLLFEKANETSEVVSDLVLGDLFVVISAEKHFLQALLPDGRKGFVNESDCLSFSEWKNVVPQAEQIIATAATLKGSPYLWGGTSSKAVDCSGLIKTAWFSQGVILARDASQQARFGEILNVDDINSFEPGDLLFFGRSKERVSHVALYIGTGKYIHASGMVRINSLNPQDPDFSEFNRNRLVSAGRVFSQLNTDGITQVKDHSWYSD